MHCLLSNHHLQLFHFGNVVTKRYVIYVKEGQYDEQVLIPKKMENITMIGDGSQKSIITGNKNFVDGLTTYKTATVGKKPEMLYYCFYFAL
jgi:pectin methylesterase-like acyl-CoA thioesterase